MPGFPVKIVKTNKRWCSEKLDCIRGYGYSCLLWGLHFFFSLAHIDLLISPGWETKRLMVVPLVENWHAVKSQVWVYYHCFFHNFNQAERERERERKKEREREREREKERKRERERERERKREREPGMSSHLIKKCSHSIYIFRMFFNNTKWNTLRQFITFQQHEEGNALAEMENWNANSDLNSELKLWFSQLMLYQPPGNMLNFMNHLNFKKWNILKDKTSTLSLPSLCRLRKPVNPNCQDDGGSTPLHHAALNGHK